MAKFSNKDLADMEVDELLAFSKNAEKLIAEKQNKRLYDAYEQYEKIADDAGVSIKEVLEAGDKLKKERSIKYRDPSNPDNTWTGRGRQPKWMTAELKKGKTVEDFAV